MSEDSAIRTFLSANGFAAGVSLTPLAGGANNRVFRVDDGGETRVLKQYFTAAGDPRDRFAAERDFYEALWMKGCRVIPEPYAWDRDARLGLFEFVEGVKPAGGVIDAGMVRQALEFAVEINRGGTAGIRTASEACFSLGEHLRIVDGRVRRLRQIPAASGIDAEAAEFVAKELAPAWQAVCGYVARAFSGRLDCELTGGQRCLSPSDFGFHNALLTPAGRLKFFDFEYAGADDPAKLVCDFFCQPRLPAPADCREWFISGFADACGWDDDFQRRAAALLPVYRIKWCCIMLNEFLRSESRRRDFAGESMSVDERKMRQLSQAREALRAVVPGNR